MPFLRALAGSLIALTLTVGFCDAKSKKHVSDDDNSSAEQGQSGSSLLRMMNDPNVTRILRGASLSSKGNGLSSRGSRGPQAGAEAPTPHERQPKKPAVVRGN